MYTHLPPRSRPCTPPAPLQLVPPTPRTRRAPNAAMVTSRTGSRAGHAGPLSPCPELPGGPPRAPRKQTHSTANTRAAGCTVRFAAAAARVMLDAAPYRSDPRSPCRRPRPRHVGCGALQVKIPRPQGPMPDGKVSAPVLPPTSRQFLLNLPFPFSSFFFLSFSFSRTGIG